MSDQQNQIDAEAKLQALEYLFQEEAVSGFVSQDKIESVIGKIQDEIETYAELSMISSDPKNISNFKASLHAF